MKRVPELRFKGFEGEWENRRLRDHGIAVIDGDRGKNYPNGDDFSETGFCLFLNAKNVTSAGFAFGEASFISEEKDKQLSKGKLKSEDVVLTTRGTVGNIAFFGSWIPYRHMRINSGMVLLRASGSRLLPQFLYTAFFAPPIDGEVKKTAFGSAQPQLTVKGIYDIKFGAPSLPEQRKIADFLTAVDRRMAQLSQKKALLENYKKGVMQQLFSQAIRFKDEHGKAFPAWEEKTLGAIATFSKGWGISKAEVHEDGALPCIRYGELYTYYAEQIRVVKSRTNLIEKDLVLSQRNDVIIPASGETHIDISTASCVTVDGVALGGDLNIIRTKQNGIFLAYYLNNACKHAIAGMAQGSSVIHLYPDQLKRLRLQLPSVKEQTKIAAFLTAIDLKIEKVTQQIAHTQTFKRGLLQQMFV